MNPGQLFPNPRSDASRKFAELAQRRSELTHEARELHQQLQAAEREREQTKHTAEKIEVEVRALGGDTARINAARKKHTAAEKRAGELEHEARVAQDAIAHIDGELRGHVTAHIDTLMAELAEDAEHAQAQLAETLEILEAAARAWKEVSTRVSGTLRYAELARDHHPPMLPPALEEATRKVGRHAASVPAPFPPHWRSVQSAADDPAITDTEASFVEVYGDAA